MVVQKNGELIIRAEQIIDEAYNKGKNDAKREISQSGEYERAYQRGLDDAWEAARKLVHHINGGYTNEQKKAVFGNMTSDAILNNFTAFEAVAKIREYEQAQAKKPGCPYDVDGEPDCGECPRRWHCDIDPEEPEGMTLDEAIAHAKDAAEYNAAKVTNDSTEAQACRQSAEEHRQLAGWLRELKERRAKE